MTRLTLIKCIKQLKNQYCYLLPFLFQEKVYSGHNTDKIVQGCITKFNCLFEGQWNLNLLLTDGTLTRFSVYVYFENTNTQKLISFYKSGGLNSEAGSFNFKIVFSNGIIHCSLILMVKNEMLLYVVPKNCFVAGQAVMCLADVTK